MVKKRVGGAHRYKAVQKPVGGDAAPSSKKQQQQQELSAAGGPKPPSHLQRKITKSVKFYEKVHAQSSTPKTPQGVTKKRKKAAKTLASLDSLAAELNHITTATAGAGAGDGSNSSSGGKLSEQQAALVLKGKGTKSSIKRSKARMAVSVTESSRLQKVLQHPAYKADPVQAVLNHLANTLPAAPAPAAPARQHKQQQQQQRKKKKKQQQGGGGGGDDDMQA